MLVSDFSTAGPKGSSGLRTGELVEDHWTHLIAVQWGPGRRVFRIPLVSESRIRGPAQRRCGSSDDDHPGDG